MHSRNSSSSSSSSNPSPGSPPVKTGGFFTWKWGRSPPPYTFRAKHRVILQREMETLFYFRTPSPVGPLFLAASTKGLVRLEFEVRVQSLNPEKTQSPDSEPPLP